MGIKREASEGSERRQILILVICVLLVMIAGCCVMRQAVASERFSKVKDALKKSGKSHFYSEAVLDEGTRKERILIVFIDANVAEWQVSYHAVGGLDRVLFIAKPAASRSVAFERWAVNDSK